jgi:Helix-hairpin-helix motif
MVTAFPNCYPFSDFRCRCFQTCQRGSWPTRNCDVLILRRIRILAYGPERAKRLLERFGTVHGCFDASMDELRKVEGIGPKIAAGIGAVIS